MRVSAKADYALRALIEIAVRTDGTAVSAEQLGKAQGIPHGFLQAILADLRRADIVVSQRGQSGGWRFARKPESVTVADVIRAVDGPLVSVYGLRPEAVEYDDSAQVLQHVWIAARHSLRMVFEQVTIQDLADGTLPAGGRRPHRGRRRLAAALTRPCWSRRSRSDRHETLRRPAAGRPACDAARPSPGACRGAPPPPSARSARPGRRAARR